MVQKGSMPWGVPSTTRLKALAIAVILGAVSFATSGFLTVPVSAYTPHPPVVIDGDANFTPENGVTGGTGTPSDPFIIEGWEIDAMGSSHGIAISSTTSHFVLRDLLVHSAGPFYSAIWMAQVSNGVVETVNVSGSRSGIQLHFSDSILIRDTNASMNVWNGISLGSSENITIIRSEASFNAAIGIEVGGSNVTIVDSTARYNSRYGVSVVLSQNATLFNITLSGNGAGLRVAYSSGIRLTGSKMLDNAQQGIWTDGSDGVSIAGSEIARNGRDGVFIDRTVSAQISDNEFASNGRYGLFIRYSIGAEIRRNAFLMDGLLFFGDAVDHYRSHEVTADNTVNGRPLSFYKDCNGVEIDGVPVGQLIFANCTQVTVSNLVLSDADVGVQMAFVDGVVLKQIEVRDNQRYGMRFEDAFAVSVEGSLLEGNRIGIGFLYSGNATIRSNVLSDGEFGIHLLSSAAIIAYQNGFWNNTVHAFDDGSNVWDNGHLVGGNFWSNYSGSDNCSGIRQDICPDPDGLGDTPFVLDEDSRDTYPLMAPPTGPNTPPAAAFELSPQTGDVTTTFVANATMSSDSEDPPPALLVRWDWEDDGAWDTGWSTNRVASHTYPAPGTYLIRLEVRDTGGLRNQTTKSLTVSPDTAGPRISHTPPTGVRVGQTVPITAAVTDAGGVSTVTLRYRAAGQTEYVAVTMTRASGDLFEAEIPAQPIAGTVEYFVTARDSWGNEERDPTTGTYALEVLAGDSGGPVPLTLLLVASVLLVLLVAVAVYYLVRKRVVWRRRKDS